MRSQQPSNHATTFPLRRAASPRPFASPPPGTAARDPPSSHAAAPPQFRSSLPARASGRLRFRPNSSIPPSPISLLCSSPLAQPPLEPAPRSRAPPRRKTPTATPFSLGPPQLLQSLISFPFITSGQGLPQSNPHFLLCSDQQPESIRPPATILDSDPPQQTPPPRFPLPLDRAGDPIADPHPIPTLNLIRSTFPFPSSTTTTPVTDRSYDLLSRSRSNSADSRTTISLILPLYSLAEAFDQQLANPTLATVSRHNPSFFALYLPSSVHSRVAERPSPEHSTWRSGCLRAHYSRAESIPSRVNSEPRRFRTEPSPFRVERNRAEPSRTEPSHRRIVRTLQRFIGCSRRAYNVGAEA